MDVLVRSADPTRIGELARQAEGQGFDALLVTENRHDPFLALALVAEHTGGIEVGTCVASALPRRPCAQGAAASAFVAFPRTFVGSPPPGAKLV